MPTSASKKRRPAKPAARDTNGRFRTSGREGVGSIKRANGAKKSKAGKQSQKPATSPPQETASPTMDLAAALEEAPNAQKGIERARVSMGEALRLLGFDEFTIAKIWVGLAKRWKEKSDAGEGTEKLLLELLKDFLRHLEPSKPARTVATAVSDARVTINLIHNVARPQRELLQSGGTASAATSVSDTAIDDGDNATPVVADDNVV
jgi:hypothetical protein